MDQGAWHRWIEVPGTDGSHVSNLTNGDARRVEAEVVFLENPVGSVARSDERSGCDLNEAAGEPPFAIGCEFVRMYPARDRQVVARRPQILPEREHIDVTCSQVVHR